MIIHNYAQAVRMFFNSVCLQDDGIKTINISNTGNNGKKGADFALDIASSILSGGGSIKIQKAFIKDAEEHLKPSVFAPMTKDEKVLWRDRKAFVESDDFLSILDAIFSYYTGAADTMIQEYTTKNENSSNN